MRMWDRALVAISRFGPWTTFSNISLASRKLFFCKRWMPRSKAAYWALASAFGAGCGVVLGGAAGMPFFPFRGFLTAAGLAATGLAATGLAVTGLVTVFFA